MNPQSPSQEQIRNNNFIGSTINKGSDNSSLNADQNSKKVSDLENRINELERKYSNHLHDGNAGNRINLFDIFGKVECLSVAPTLIPQTVFDQVKVATVAGTVYLYVYDSLSAAWKKVTIA